MLVERITGVFKLDVNTFEEIEADQTATSQAAIVVIAVAILAGLGGGLAGRFTNISFIGGFLNALVSVLVGWFLWSLLTYLIGTNLFDGQADLGEMLRVIGFAYAPQVLAIIPCIGWIIGIVWTLAAAFVAIRQGLDLDNGKTVITIGISLLAYIAIIWILRSIFGGIF